MELTLGRFNTGLPFNDNILFFSIININILLILLLIFLVVRNLVKLIFERRRKILGTQLRSKLVASFILLSLVPTGILFYVSWFFISRSVEMWVHVQVEQALEESLAVARTYYKGHAEDTLFFAKQISQAVKREKFSLPKQQDKLREFLRLQQAAFRIDAIHFISPNFKFIIKNSSAPPFLSPQLSEKEAFFKEWKGMEISRIRDAGAGEVIEAVVPIFFGDGKEKDSLAALVVQKYVPQNLVYKMAKIAQSLDRHQQMILYKLPFKSVIFMALIMVTFLILFAATWFGIMLAKGITIPLQHLAEGIRAVAAGNLEYRIEMASEDEMGILVDSFNRMIEDLKRKDEQVDEAQLCLHQSNLESEQRRRDMEILLRNIGAGVLSLDQQGRIQTMNRFMEELFCIQASDFIGRGYQDLFLGETMQPIRDFIGEMSQIQAKNRERQIQVVFQQEPKNFYVRMSILEDETGAGMGLVIVIEDHSELIRAQRAAAWREVARRIAHEIKNPLTPIQLSAQRLRKRYAGRFKQDEKIFEECTNTIIRQVEEMKNLVNEFSDFARMPAANPLPCNLNEIVREVLTLYQQVHRSISFSFEEDAQLPLLLLDPDQILRAITNLLDNAVDASHDSQQITLMTRHDPFLRIAVLDIADQGCGISKEMLGRIFDPYTSTKKSGTGLGLTIVRTIIADHNGYIRVRDNQPQGTCFTLEFPVSTD